MMMIDPFGVKRPLLLLWNGVFWTVASQWYDATGTAEKSTQLMLTNIASYEDNSVITAYGTDGTSLYRLFDHPDPKLPKRLSTKAFSGDKGAKVKLKFFSRVYMEVHDNSGEGWQRRDSQTVISVPQLPVGCSFTGNFTTREGSIPNGTYNVGFELSPGVTYGVIPWPLQAYGLSGELDLISYSPDFTIERFHFAVDEKQLYGA